MIDISSTYAVVGSGLAVVGFIINSTWSLSEKFNLLNEKVVNLLDAHEEKDQHRHEDNIQRFAIIETKLDTVIKNGKY